MQHANSYVAAIELKLQKVAIRKSKDIFLFNLKVSLASQPEIYGLEEIYIRRIQDAFQVNIFHPLLERSEVTLDPPHSFSGAA